MIAALALLLGLAQAPAPPAPPPAAEPAAGLQLAFETVDGRPALRLSGPGELRGVVVRREGGELVVSLPGVAPPAHLPEPQPPIEDLRVEQAQDRVELRLLARPELPFELRRDAGQLLLVFGQRAPEQAAGFPDLYRGLFPSGLFAEPGEAEAPPVPEGEEKAGDGRLGFGPLSFRPAVLGSYVEGESTVEDRTPTADKYWQIEPKLDLLLSGSVGSLRLKASYQPVFRFDSRYEQVNRTSHLFDAGLELPIGAPFTLRADVHYALGTLETREVDPGYEYYYDLGRFDRWRYGVGLRFETGGRFDLDLSGQVNQVDFQEQSTFFSFDDRQWTAELGYDLTPDVRAGLGYTREEVPADSVLPERPEAVSNADLVRLRLDGRMASFDGELSAGYERREQPLAGPGGQLYQGFVAGARLRRELRQSTFLSLGGARYTTLSSFESNGYYVSNALEALLTSPGPFNVSLRGGLAWQWNQYDVVESTLGEPRSDKLWGWTVGLGRPLSRWAYLRVDYRKDHRDSNLNEFDTDTYSLIAQVGVGWFGGSGGR